jgi:hypothetical protein
VRPTADRALELGGFVFKTATDRAGDTFGDVFLATGDYMWCFFYGRVWVASTQLAGTPKAGGRGASCPASEACSPNQVGRSRACEAFSETLAGIGELSYNDGRFSVWRKSPRALLLVS